MQSADCILSPMQSADCAGSQIACNTYMQTCVCVCACFMFETRVTVAWQPQEALVCIYVCRTQTPVRAHTVVTIPHASHEFTNDLVTVTSWIQVMVTGCSYQSHAHEWLLCQSLCRHQWWSHLVIDHAIKYFAWHQPVITPCTEITNQANVIILNCAVLSEWILLRKAWKCMDTLMCQVSTTNTSILRHWMTWTLSAQTIYYRSCT